MARVELQNLSKAFPGPRGEPVWAVRRAGLAVADGEFLVLVGPSGAGKSTLLRLIAGLEDVTEGNILIDGQSMNGVDPKDRDIAMVFQNHALYPHFTARENMAFGLKLRKFPQPEIERRVREAAVMLGLEPCLDRKPAALSGGERQRVALGRALVRQPKVFLFDEPLSNLDARMREQLRAELLRLHQRLGATMICVTHDQADAMTLGDRIAVLRDGVIQQVAAPLDLYRQPANLFVAGFIGSPPMNFFRGQLARRDGAVWFEASGGGLSWPLPEGQAQRRANRVGQGVILGLRPEHIACGGNSTGTAIVEVAETTGAQTDLYLKSGGLSFVARVPASESWKAGDAVPFRFDLAQAHFFDPATETALP